MLTRRVVLQAAALLPLPMLAPIPHALGAPMRYHYTIAPWEWRNEAWVPPRDSVGSYDLRSLTEQAQRAERSGWGFFATIHPIDGHALGQGDLRGIATTDRIRRAFLATTGFQPDGRTLADCLWRMATAGGDPAGSLRSRPLLPVGQQLVLTLGGHGILRQEPFVWGEHPHTSQVQAVLQQDIGALMTTVPLASVRKVLGALTRQYDVPWWSFVPRDGLPHIPGPMLPATTIHDTFNRADGALGTSSDGDWSWTDDDVGLAIESNVMRCTSTGYGRARAEKDLSSADMYASCSNLAVNLALAKAGLLVRFSVSAVTYYVSVYRSDAGSGNAVVETFKVVAGTATSLAGPTDTGSGANLTAKLQTQGSQVTTRYNAAMIHTLTDTAITGHQRAGIEANNFFSLEGGFDNFEAADILHAYNHGGFFPRRQH